MKRAIWITLLVLLTPCVLVGLIISCLYRPQVVISDMNVFMQFWWRAWGYKPKWGEDHG